MGRGAWWATVHGVAKADSATKGNQHNKVKMKILYIESLSRDPLQVGSFILKFSFSANNHEAKILKLFPLRREFGRKRCLYL